MTYGRINITAMRWQCLIVLMAITVSAVASPSLPPTIAYDRESMIEVLNVCHPVTLALSSNGDMPYMNEHRCSHVPLPSDSCSESLHPVTTPMFFPKTNEHPPNA